jgi:cytochrome P450
MSGQSRLEVSGESAILKTVSDLPKFDYGSSDFAAQPFATLGKFARQTKLGRSARGVEIFDYELCRKAIVDRRLGSGHPRLMKLLELPEGPALDYKRNSISYHNRTPARRRLRKPLMRLLGPEGSEGFRRDVKQIVKQTFDGISTTGPVDLITALCDQIPSRVYCHWTNAPSQDAALVSRLSHIVQQVHTRDPALTNEVAAGFGDLLNYVDTRIAAARRNIGDDLLSDLIRATDAGQLTEDELRNWMVKLAEANTDNSSHQIAIAIIELASRPEIWARLGKDPSLVPTALREVMRFHPRSISTSRETLEDIELDGCLLPEGTAVFPNIGAAHWNADYYLDPEIFNINRKNEPLHLNFGGGIFSCIGRFIVTIEIEETISFMAARFPDIALRKARFDHSPMFTSVTALEAVLETE